MKQFIINTIILITVFTKMNGQLLQRESAPEGEKLYIIGSELMKSGDYWGADSVFTQALCSYKNEDVYYNRGVARFFLLDTIGFCQDLDVASSRYYDKESAILFSKFCCDKADTIFYDKKFDPVLNSDYRFFEVIRKLKYDSIITGTLHDAKIKKNTFIYDSRCDSEIPLINRRLTDIFAAYILVDSVRYFYQASSPVIIYNPVKYDEFIMGIEDHLKTKYGYIKEKNKLEEIELFYEFAVTTTGEVINIKYLGAFPELLFEEDDIEIEKELLILLKDHPKFVPATVRQNKVNYIAHSSITF